VPWQEGRGDFERNHGEGKGPPTAQRPRRNLRRPCAALDRDEPAAPPHRHKSRQPPSIPSAAVVLAIGGDVAGRPPE